MVRMMSTEEGAVALWMRGKSDLLIVLWAPGYVRHCSGKILRWDRNGIDMRYPGRRPPSSFPSSLPRVTWTPRSLLRSSSIIYLESLYSVTQVADLTWHPPPISPPQSASGPVIQLGRFKASALKNRDGSPPRPFPFAHFRLLGISWQCRANDFLIPIDAKLINLLHNFHGVKLPRGWND